MTRLGPPPNVPPDRLFRLLLRAPRASLPIQFPLAGAPPGAFRVLALHPLDEAEAIERHMDAPEGVRESLVGAELAALALHDGAERIFDSGAHLLSLFTARDADALISAARRALDIVSPSFWRIDEPAWERRLADGALRGRANHDQAIALALSMQDDARRGIPRPEWFFGVPSCELTDGQRLIFSAARKAVFGEAFE